MDQTYATIALSCTLVGISGCGDDTPSPAYLDLYANEVVEFLPGDGAGYGAEELPNVVLGPPASTGTGAGSLDVVSLGVGGSIVLGFPRPIRNIEGPDFVVFENAFRVAGTDEVFTEPGEVGVSADGTDWRWFPCEDVAPYAGCAGLTPTLAFAPESMAPIDPQQTGGDAFDIQELGLEEVLFVSIRDRSTEGEAPTAGFDLDAIGVIR